MPLVLKLGGSASIASLLLSPEVLNKAASCHFLFFNYFINAILKNLNATADGVCIDNFSLNNFAYADDVTLLATTYLCITKSYKLLF